MRRRRSDGWDNRCRENKGKGRKQDRQIEKKNKTDRESVHEKEKKWLDGATDVEKTKKSGESKTDR